MTEKISVHIQNRNLKFDLRLSKVVDVYWLDETNSPASGFKPGSSGSNVKHFTTQLKELSDSNLNYRSTDIV